MKVSALNSFNLNNYPCARNCSFKSVEIFSNVKDVDLHKMAEPYKPILKELDNAGLDCKIEYNSKSPNYKTIIELSRKERDSNTEKTKVIPIFGYHLDKAISKKAFDEKMLELIEHGINYMNSKIKKLEEMKTEPEKSMN